MEIEEKVLELCEDLCCQKLSADEQLIASGLLDSFKIMELICSLEEMFSIAFLPEEIMETDYFSCVNNIVRLVGNKIS